MFRCPSNPDPRDLMTRKVKMFLRVPYLILSLVLANWTASQDVAVTDFVRGSLWMSISWTENTQKTAVYIDGLGNWVREDEVWSFECLRCSGKKGKKSETVDW
ncbi:hypothetical protein SISSUDRAFT_220651 [Sistotremastrum suecicum HHB10207 ss-3]|uniref:Uncharacterized protein n=1 Tax=Sistotremastrum suecicum HHB10207 ss-3 TaxID=1314776 RepID=A0A166A578_9AGAM|nr:hypothetical protein SISSUDRAFT_220651 [Sistotremastrum suecicum HHB10207 ss-3]